MKKIAEDMALPPAATAELHTILQTSSLSLPQNASIAMVASRQTGRRTSGCFRALTDRRGADAAAADLAGPLRSLDDHRCYGCLGERAPVSDFDARNSVHHVHTLDDFAEHAVSGGGGLVAAAVQAGIVD